MTSKKSQKRKHLAQDSDSEDGDESIHVPDEEGGIRFDDIYIPPPPRAVCSATSAGPRLIITNIVNDWFKSYADGETVGPFHKCFNAIVGPNGSGKSNVIDSLLFVFGYRASKLRSKKLSVLIHNSEAFQNVQSCTVSIHFTQIIDKEGDAYDVVPNSDFVVSRTTHKDNSSFYQLNGQRVQFKEVAVLLRKHGIDLDHNRFLILQGEVEQISLMKCKGANEHETGMLEYLEDIIGTSRYKEPLNKLYERVEILTEQRSDKVNRLKVVENDLNELRGPMEEAIGFLELENKITKNKNDLYQKHICNIEEEIKVAEAQKEEIEQEQKQYVDKLHDLVQDRKANEKALETKSQKYNGLRKKKDMLREAFDRANNRDIQLQAEMQQLNKTRKKTKELLVEERQKLVGYEKVPEKSAESIVECEEKEEELLAKKEKLEKEKTKLLSTLRSETQDLQERKESIQTEMIGLTKLVDEAKSAYSLAESELRICLSNEENEHKKLQTLQQANETNKITVKARSVEIEQLKKKIPHTEKSLKEATAELDVVKLEEANSIGEIRRKRMTMEETRMTMQASRSRGRVLDSLMQQKREGKCHGLFGRLGDLGAIDQKYDVAISTACGALDNIVVDTVSTAEWCIEFLKKYDIGRATFIALEKQEHLRAQANSLIQTPEKVPRLFDLVRIEDEHVRTAFYFALRDTLVADNLDQASRIAYGAKRYRVVTLAGHLIETTGTMSGGGKTVSRGRMGQSVTAKNVNPQEIENMERDLGELEEGVRQLRQRQINLESQINTLQPELRQMKVNFEKYTIEVQSLKEQQPTLVQQIKVQEKKAMSATTDPKKLKQFSAAVATKKSAYEEAAANVAVFQVEVDEITKEIQEKTFGKMKAMDKSINDVNKTIDKCKAEITRLRVSMKTAERNAKKSAEKIIAMEQDVEKAEDSLRKIKTEREEIESDAEQLLRAIEEIGAQLSEEEDGFASIQEKVKRLTDTENKLKSEKIEVDQKLKTINKSLSDLKVQIHSWRVKLTQLKLHRIQDVSMDELKTYSLEEMKKQDLQHLQLELQANQEVLKTTKPNLSAIEAYQKKQSAFVQRSNELEEITERRNKMREMHETFRSKRKEEFLTGYNIIKMKLKEMYQMITLGGDADFEMVDTYDPFSEGIQFNVRPPKKSWKNICNLSGGEKTLSSLALVFALHYYKPSPLYVMDEIDAALDFKNVSIVGNYIKERTKNAQFIIISLRSNMFELCDYLVGICKVYNCTMSITIDPRSFGNDNREENHDNQNPTAIMDKENDENQDPNANRTEENGAASTGNIEASREQSNPIHNRSEESDDGHSNMVNRIVTVVDVHNDPGSSITRTSTVDSTDVQQNDDEISSVVTRPETSMDDVIIEDSFQSEEDPMEVDN